MTRGRRPVVREGQILVHQVMTATLSDDHRTIDEAAIARFLGDPKERPQPPGTRAEAAPGIPV